MLPDGSERDFHGDKVSASGCIMFSFLFDQRPAKKKRKWQKLTYELAPAMLNECHFYRSLCTS